MNDEVDAARQALRTPRAAAISGIAFSVLLTASLVLIRLAVPGNPRTASVAVANTALRNSLLVALNLAPFVGIAFLWFIGVVRDRMGQHEDRFFASVFLGSGILFVAMLFVTTAMAGGLITSATGASGDLQASDAWRIGRAVMYTLMTTYAMRMAAVFMISTATIALHTAIMPQWLGLLGYAVALVLLLSVGYLPWVEVLFPAWVFVVSLYILIASFHEPRKAPYRSSLGGSATS
ncbi:MAG: hypothetical protein ACRDHP_02200 [Ktedonobacterales bacterium]